MPPAAEERRLCADYERFRERYWRFVFYFFGICATAFPLSFAAPWVSRPVETIAIMLMVGYGFIFWIIATFALYQAITWRCPQCGNYFAICWYSAWPGNKCKHCGLDARYN
jgi:hypothetical protein